MKEVRKRIVTWSQSRQSRGQKGVCAFLWRGLWSCKVWISAWLRRRCPVGGAGLRPRARQIMPLLVCRMLHVVWINYLGGVSDEGYIVSFRWLSREVGGSEGREGRRRAIWLLRSSDKRRFMPWLFDQSYLRVFLNYCDLMKYQLINWTICDETSSIVGKWYLIS